MTLSEIRAAVDAGTTVHWANESYRVIKDRLGQYLVIYTPNGSAIGLTDQAGQRLNGRKADFFVVQAGTDTSGSQAPRQKGTVENTNNRLRKIPPRSTEPTARKCLGYRTPAEVFEAKLVDIRNRLT